MYHIIHHTYILKNNIITSMLCVRSSACSVAEETTSSQKFEEVARL